jgi:hypothetical protein
MPKNHHSIAQQLAFNRGLEYKRLRQERAKEAALAELGLVIRHVHNTDEYTIEVCDHDRCVAALARFKEDHEASRRAQGIL